jgi:hypothetical protein
VQINIVEDQCCRFLIVKTDISKFNVEVSLAEVEHFASSEVDLGCIAEKFK